MRKSLSIIQTDARKQLSSVLSLVLKKKSTSSDTIPSRYQFTVSKYFSRQILKLTAKGSYDRPSLFLRGFVESALRNRRHLTPSQESELRQLIIYLRNNGELLNQIAKYTNTVQRVTYAELAKAKEIAEDQEKRILTFLLDNDR